MGSVGIIGTGKTGFQIAFAFCCENNSETSDIKSLWLYSRDSRDLPVPKSLAAIADLRDASQFTIAPSLHHASCISDLFDTDVIIVCLKNDYTVTELSGDIRVSGLKHDLPLLLEIANEISGFEGHVLVLTNPVDIVTRILAEFSDLDSWQFFSFGAELDNARVKSVLVDNGYDASGLESEYVGEHGPSGVIRFSRIRYEGELLEFSHEERMQVERKVKERGYHIVSAFDTSLAGPALGVARATRTLLNGGTALLGVPQHVDGKPHFVYAAVPVAVDGKGISPKIPSVSANTGYQHEREKEEASQFKDSIGSIKTSSLDALHDAYRLSGRGQTL